MIRFGDLKREYKEYKEKIDQAIENVLNSGWFILGQQVENFEHEFSSYLGSRYGVGVGSGTEALHLALLACGIKPGDEVITVPNTAVPTVSAIDFANARPVFVDINPDTYCLNVEKLEEKITARTKAIIPVQLFGHPVDMDPLLKIAKRHDLKVIEDASQSHGAEYKNKKVGTIGDCGCFSFYPSKNLGAYGDGGFVATDDASIFEKVHYLRNYGQEDRYHHVQRGFNSRLDEIQAAILRVKLKYLDINNERRRELANLYRSLLKSSEVSLPFEAEYAKHVFYLYVIRCKKRYALQQWLQKKGVETLVHYPVPIYSQKAYKYLNINSSLYPVAERYVKEFLSLPIYPQLKKGEVEIIADLVNQF